MNEDIETTTPEEKNSLTIKVKLKEENIELLNAVAKNFKEIERLLNENKSLFKDSILKSIEL